MAVTRAEKETQLEGLSSAFTGVETAILVDYKGLNVPQVTELRRQLRTVKASYRVVKNTLARRAIKGTAFEPLDVHFAGTTAIAYTGDDPVALAKALTAYAKTNPAFTFKSGFVEGRVVEVKSIQELASMPSKEELYAKILFLINASAQRLVTAVSGVGRNLAVVVDQGVKENKFQG